MLKTAETWAKMIKLEHTLFSLPFVLSSALLAIYYQAGVWQPMTFVWIALCLLGARSAGMTINRIIDADIDAKNPRTKEREIPSGQISKTQAWVFAVLSLALLTYSAFQLPKLCQILLPIALIWLVAYSYLKRLTWLCHLFLGTTLGGGTLGAWIAVTGNLDSLAPVYLSLAVTFWVTGFDIYYSSQDTDFDKKAKLHSIPAKFGIETAFRIARVCHGLTPIFLFLAGRELALGFWYKMGVLIVIGALFYEQLLVKENKIEKAFFDVNSWISVLILVFVCVELYL